MMILEDFNDQITKGIFKSNNVITTDLCFLRAWFIVCHMGSMLKRT